MPAEERLVAEARAAGEVPNLPLLQPDAIPKRHWVNKQTHGKANARGLTGAEIAGRELKAQERRTAKGVNTPGPAGRSHLDSPYAGKRKKTEVDPDLNES